MRSMAPAAVTVTHVVIVVGWWLIAHSNELTEISTNHLPSSLSSFANLSSVDRLIELMLVDDPWVVFTSK
jgi:hypothetical protein